MHSSRTDFIRVTDKDLLGKWSVLFFLRRTSPLCARPSLKTCRASMLISRESDVKFILWYPLCSQSMAWIVSGSRQGQYPMIGDPTGKLSKELDIYIEDSGLTERGTFIINPKGEVVLYEVSAGRQHRPQCGRAASQGGSRSVRIWAWRWSLPG